MLPVPLPLPHPSEAAAAATAVVVVLSLLLIDGRGSLLVLPHALHASMTTGATWLLLGLLTLLSATTTCDASCYFSLDLQGDYLMQSSPINSGSPVQYSQVIITAEAISIWGLCHRRIGSNVVLKDSLGDPHSSGTSECFRCVTLQPRSRNVIELLAESLDKCYMTEEVAQSNCPDERSKNRSFSRIILYKTKDLIGTEIRPEYCPINGRFTFIYNRNDDLENKLECRTPMSELDNCPSGAELNLHFRQCLSEHFDMTFQCLGHWSTTGNQAYLALLDIKAPVEKQPKYRCAMFRENPVTGSIQIAFSRDSTCTTDLSSAISGYETVILTPIPSNGWPDAAYAAKCRFPEWAEGKWQHVTVENNTLTYIDHEKFKTYTLRCLDTAPNPERYYVFARTQCGEELYTCIWMKYRGVNVFEFQIGSYSSGILNSSLCSDYNFRDTTWITQGRTKRFKEIPCPIRGEYTGIIPDAESPKLCAKLSSDCKAPEIMYYTVSECDISQVYEEREYRCLGQWEENGRLYTFTQRRDATSYECFVGSKNNEINIKEAGEHCDRRIDPLQEGMKLNRIGSCHESENNAHTERTIPTRPSPNITRMTPRPTFQPTKPWKPITAPPKVINRHNSACHLAISPRLILVLSYIIYLLSV